MSNLHHFDADGYYAGTTEVPVNPVTGKPFAINEAVATLDPLPTYAPEVERVRRINGVWVIESIPAPEPEPEAAPEPPEEEVPEIPEHIPTIEDLRHEALESVNVWRLREEQKDIVFDFDGSEWDGGLTTRQRLQPVLSLPELPDGFFWTDHHNNDVPVTAETLQQLNAASEAALVAEGFRIHVAQRQMKAAIATMTRDQLNDFAPDKWLQQLKEPEPV